MPPADILPADQQPRDRETERLEADLRATLQEMAHLQNELAKSNAALLMLQRTTPQASLESAEDREVIAAISQEIRQPMSSILGYTDLLLTESVGILGALQRKFLERIRASTERMRSMLDDLIHVAAMGDGSLELLPKPVELGTIIDGAMADTSAQLREKKITLRVDLPAEMPRIYADRDALQQIAVHLLQNAGAATPTEGSVTLRARIQQENQEMYLLLQVTDSGGGIQPEQIARVFNRRLRADKPLIQGVGDTGVGLSIAKTLAEAHGGRIWVDTETGQSTTFSVLLPLRQDPIETARE
jgi:signal transduction histidine kinase